MLEYEKPTIGGGEVNKFDPAVKVDGTLLTEGYIAIQGESHPTEFRKIELLNLSGCMDPKSPKYKSYYVHQGEGLASRRQARAQGSRLRAQAKIFEAHVRRVLSLEP